MSDELRLPDDLAACEARLAAQAIPASRIDRDELLYRAGWAACEARLLSANAPATKLPPGRGRTTGWSLASAAIAASLAVAATLQWQGSVGPGAPTIAKAPTNNAQRPVEIPAANLPSASPLAPSSLASLAMLRQTTELEARSASLLTARDQAIRQSVYEPTLFHVALTATKVTSGTSGAPKTARELLDEYLPIDSAPNNLKSEPSHQL